MLDYYIDLMNNPNNDNNSYNNNPLPIVKFSYQMEYSLLNGYNKHIQENFSEKIKLPYPTYIINLEETEEGKRRLPIIQGIFHEAKRFPATYGKNIDFTPYYDTILTKSWDHGKWKTGKSNIVELTDGEKGVAMSHYNLWTKISKEKEPHIILEDDAIGGINSNTQIFLNEILRFLDGIKLHLFEGFSIQSFIWSLFMDWFVESWLIFKLLFDSTSINHTSKENVVADSLDTSIKVFRH